MSAAFFEIFIKEMKCIGTSWAEIAFDHQVFDELSLLVYCFGDFWSIWASDALGKIIEIPSIVGHAFYSPSSFRLES